MACICYSCMPRSLSAPGSFIIIQTCYDISHAGHRGFLGYQPRPEPTHGRQYRSEIHTAPLNSSLGPRALLGYQSQAGTYSRQAVSPKHHRSEEHTSELQSLRRISYAVFFFNDTATTEIYTNLNTLSLHDALPIWFRPGLVPQKPSMSSVANVITCLYNYETTGVPTVLVSEQD